MSYRHAKKLKLTLPTTLLMVLTLALATANAAHAAAPVKLDLYSHIGWEVNKTTKANLCTIPSKDECQHATATDKAGGFRASEGVAAIPKGLPDENNIYVTDNGNHRVQELTPTGEFVAMYGKNVNGKGSNVCLKAEENNCTTGEPGTQAGAFIAPESITVDPTTGNWFVVDLTNERIDEYTPAGVFVLMVGGEVNETMDNTVGATEAQKNLCTTASKDTCKAGVQYAAGSSEEGSFDFATSAGNLLSTAGSLLYVGDEHRIQEFDESGEWKGEIALPEGVAKAGGRITGLAVDGETNIAYVVYAEEPVVREYSVTTGVELAAKIDIAPREVGQPVAVPAIALDVSGHLAVWASEGEGGFVSRQQYGTLYNGADGQLLTEFITPGPLTSDDVVGDIGFDGKGRLYAAFSSRGELWSYEPVPVAELTTETFGCVEGLVKNTSVSMKCTLHGSVDPDGIANTEVWFAWGRETNGRCTLTAETPHMPLPAEEAVLPVSGEIEGLRPNQGFCYQLTGTDEHSEPPETLDGLTQSGRTPVVAPLVSGASSASFVRATSALFFGELNPENAKAEYYFEYSALGPLSSSCPNGMSKEECPGVSRTPTIESEIYGRIGATLEASDLQPETTYYYRLAANNEVAGVLGEEGTPFETLEMPPVPEYKVPVGSFEEHPPTLETPAAVTQLPVPPFSFPKTSGPAPKASGPVRPKAKCKHGYTRNSRGKCVKTKAKKSKRNRGSKK
jgi:hypothetical protein